MSTERTTWTVARARRVLVFPAVLAVVGIMVGGLLGLGSLVALAAQNAAINEDVARRYFDELHTEGNLAVAAEIIPPDAVFHTPDGDLVGPEAVAGLVTVLRTAFPDATFPMDDLVVTDDTAVVRLSLVGTHTGDFQGIPPSGAEVSMDGIAIMRIEDDLIVEYWVQFDRLDLLHQIGAVTTSASSCRTPRPEPRQRAVKGPAIAARRGGVVLLPRRAAGRVSRHNPSSKRFAPR